MRIVFVAWRDLAHPNAGGSEVVVDRLARELAERGHETTLVCGGPATSRGYPVLEAGGTYSQYLRAPIAVRKLLADSDSGDPALVVDVVNGMPYFSPLWWDGPKLVLLHHVHGDQWRHYFPEPVARAGAFIECKLMPSVYSSTHFLTISPSTKKSLEEIGVASERIHVMFNGLDATAFEPACTRSEEPMFLALARLAPNKRVDLLLELWEQVRPQTGGRLVIAGDGPELDRLRSLAGAGVEFEGRVTEERKRELLSQSWLLVHPAMQEGWGLVIMEAAAVATASLGFDVPGVRDTIVDGITGELAHSGDDFAARWIALTRDTSRRELLGEQARHRAQEFTWDATVDDFLKAAAAAANPVVPNPVVPNPVAANLAVSKAGGTRASAAQGRAKRRGAGWSRSAELVRLFRNEQADPDAFYTFLADDTIEHVRQHVELDGSVCADIGGGPGYMAEALRRAGAFSCVVEYAYDELLLHDRKPDTAVQGDGRAIPLATGSVDLCHSSNVLEHVPEPMEMLDEMARVLKPATGIGYVTFTNWYSPWGGHETSPWHYFGGERAVARYRRRYGNDPKNRFGEGLFPLHIATVLDWFARRPDIEVLWHGPRYLPDALAWITSVPAVREVVTWNLAVVFRRP